MPTILFTTGIVTDLCGSTIRLVRRQIQLLSWDGNVRFIENSGSPETGSCLIECNMHYGDLVARLTTALATPDTREKDRCMLQISGCHETRIADGRREARTHHHRTLSIPEREVRAMLHALNSPAQRAA